MEYWYTAKQLIWLEMQMIKQWYLEVKNGLPALVDKLNTVTLTYGIKDWRLI